LVAERKMAVKIVTRFHFVVVVIALLAG